MLKVRTFTFAFIAAALSLAVFAGALFNAAPAGADELDPSAIEQDFIARINGLRASQGLGELAADSAQLNDVARGWAASMADAGGISHRPDLVTVAPSSWTRLGENVGVGPNTEAIHTAFIASPGHYKNLVEPAFTTIAVGVVVRDGRIYVTENFMTGNARAAAAAPGGESAQNINVAPVVDDRGTATVTKVSRSCKAGKCRLVKVKVKVKSSKAKAGKRVVKRVARHR